jgi:polyisoprenoid-binding protein YceI
MTTTTTPDLLSTLQGTWDLDPTHTEVGFSIRHLMVSKVRGRFTRVTGAFVVGATLDASHVEAEVDLASVDTNHADRDAHVRNADFLDVERFPTMTYRSTGVRAEGDHYLVDGELSLHGVTRVVPLRLEVDGYLPQSPFGDTRVGLSATGEIDRRDFDLHWNGPVEGGGVILGHTVAISLAIEAIRRSDA